MRPYRPSWGIPSDDILPFLLFMVGGSLIIGGVVFAVSHIIYIIWVAPVVIGAIAGYVMFLMVKRIKIHQPILAIILGVLFATGIVAVIHFGDYYIDFRGEVREAVARKTRGAYTEGDVDEVMNAYLYDETGKVGFIGFLEYSMAGKSTLSSITTDLYTRQESTFLLWGGEFLIIAIIAAVVAFMVARRPFNEQIHDWYDDNEHVGYVAWKQREEFEALMKKGDLENAAKYVRMVSADAPVVDVSIHRTKAAPQTDILLIVRELAPGQNGAHITTITQGLLTPTEFGKFFHIIKSIHELRRQANAQAAASAN